MSHYDDYEPPLDFEDEPRRYSQRGSRTTVPDSRVSKFITWGWTALGAAAVSGVWIASNNLYQINLTLAANAIFQQQLQRQIDGQAALNDRQEDHINAVDRRVYTIEGRNLRGGPETQRGR